MNPLRAKRIDVIHEKYFLKIVVLCVLLLLVGKSALAQTELIRNGGFETLGDGSWSVTTNGANQTNSWWNIPNASGAHSGSRYQYIGAQIDGVSAANNVDGSLYQTVTIPTGTTSATLSYYVRITTSESPASAFDHLDVEIRNASGTVLAIPLRYSNQSSSQFSSWTQQTVNLSSYAGQTIRVAFHGTTDPSVMTVFRIDDVSLQVSGTTATAPTAQTLAASLVTTTSAQMNASVNPNGSSTSAYFEYGATTSYGGTTTAGNFGNGTSPVAIQSSRSGLTPNTTYHYRVVATNSGGTNRGLDASFATQPVTVTPVPIVNSISPTAMTANGTNQLLTIYGSNFQSGNIVQFQWVAGGGAGVWTNSLQMATINSASQRITIYMNPGTLNNTFYVRVCRSASATATADCSSGTQTVTTSTTGSGGLRTYSDDYPYLNANYTSADPWLFFYRECTSFIAWRMNRDASTMTAPYFFSNYMNGGHWGDAEHWDENAAALGYLVDQSPAVGAIAHWNSTDLNNPSFPGHVAYVERVNSDGSVDVTEYNHDGNHAFGYRLNVTGVPRYIHIVANTPPVVVPVPTVNSIYPTSMAADGANQLLTIYGSNFQSGNIGQWQWNGTSGAWTNFTNMPTINRSGQITINMNPSMVAGTMYVRVCRSVSATTTADCSGSQALAVTSVTTYPSQYFLTVISHGLGSNASGWVHTMAQAIAARSAAGRSTKIYSLVITQDGVVGVMLPSFDKSTAHHIVQLDWSEFSLACPDPANQPTVEVAKTAFKSLETQIKSLPSSHIALHLIGHSRGASLVGALASEFQKAGLVFDDVHLTTLDPHPYVNSSTCNGDFPLDSVPSSVKFWDNYYQTETIASGSAYPSAWNLNLDSVLSQLDLVPNHTQVHAYYHGTVDSGATTDGDGTDIKGSWYAGTCFQEEAGYTWTYYESRYGRPSRGVSNPLCRTGYLIKQPKGNPVKPCNNEANLTASEPSAWYDRTDTSIHLTFPEAPGAVGYQIFFGDKSGQTNYTGTTDLGAYQGGRRTFPGIPKGTYFGVMSSYNTAVTTPMFGGCSTEKTVTVP